MPKTRPIVVLNEVQMSAFEMLQEVANSSNMIAQREIVRFKMNVIKALIARNVLTINDRQQYRLAAVTVVLKPPVKTRTPKAVVNQIAA